MTKMSRQPSQPGAAPASLSRRQLLASATLAGAGMVPVKAVAETPASSADMGGVWWSELQTANPGRASAFYAGVMGWTPKVVALEDPSRPPKTGEKQYVLFSVDGREVAGAVELENAPGEAPIPMWLTYIQVANVDHAVLKAVELGGKLLEAPADVPTAGRIAVIEDPEGVRVGLIAPSASSKG